MRRRDPRVKAWNRDRQSRGDGEGADGADDELSPGGGPNGAERDDEQQHRKVQEVREGRDVFVPGTGELPRRGSLGQRLVREAAESHEVEPRDRIAFDEFKHEQQNHAG